jgi:hypothetical protein
MAVHREGMSNLKATISSPRKWVRVEADGAEFGDLLAKQIDLI